MSEDFAKFKYTKIFYVCRQERKKSEKLSFISENSESMNISNCDGFGLIHRLIKLVEATNLEHGSQDGADGGDTELNGGGGSEMEDLRYVLHT